jgi:coenzyme Q-binding protein COQ10
MVRSNLSRDDSDVNRTATRSSLVRALTLPTGAINLSCVVVRRPEGAGKSRMRHWKREFPRFTPEQLFALVSDVENYPLFMPGCLSARIVEKNERIWRVENVFGVGPIRRRFLSIAKLDPPRAIEISSNDELWRDFRVYWRFDPCGRGCYVSCATSAVFRSPLLAALAKISEAEMEDRVITAFEARARILFNHHRRQ